MNNIAFIENTNHVNMHDTKMCNSDEKLKDIQECTKRAVQKCKQKLCQQKYHRLKSKEKVAFFGKGNHLFAYH